MHWSWRQHAVVCAVLVALLIPVGAAEALWVPAPDPRQPGAQGMLLVPAALWVGGMGALSTALIALLKPSPARVWQGYVLGGLLAAVGLGGLTTIAERLDRTAPSEPAQAIASAVTLDSLTVEGTDASAAITVSSPTRLRHITLRSQDSYCEGTEWPDATPLSGAHTFRISLRCAGGVTEARSWRLSTVAEQGEETATLVWSNEPETTPRAIVRPLP